MVVAFLVGAVVAGGIGLPVDYVWRRFSGAVGIAAGFVNAVAVVAVIVVLTQTGLLHSAWSVPAVVFGLIAGNAVANEAATRLWGPARHRW